MGVSQKEAAQYLGITRDQLQGELRRRPELQEAYNQGLAEVKLSLRGRQIQKALEGNVQMLIWMGKQLLGQAESPSRIEEGWEVGGEHTITITMPPELRDRIEAARRRASPEALEILAGRPREVEPARPGLDHQEEPEAELA